MKGPSITFLFIFIFQWLVAQESFKKCSNTYFKNGKVATSQCMNDANTQGKATAYNMKGEVIGEWQISRMHMLSGVSFSFHPNGMVHKAEFSSHPDAGIQWYKSYTEYDEQGLKISFIEQHHDDRLNIMEPGIVKQRPAEKDTAAKTILKQEVAECAVIYVSELWLDNRTGKNITIKCKPGFGEGEEKTITIPAGKRAKINERIMAQLYEDPFPFFSVTVFYKSGKPVTGVTFSNLLTDESRLKENRKGFVYDLGLK